jgi:hypothetical protein
MPRRGTIPEDFQRAFKVAPVTGKRLAISNEGQNLFTTSDTQDLRLLQVSDQFERSYGKPIEQVDRAGVLPGGGEREGAQLRLTSASEGG